VNGRLYCVLVEKETEPKEKSADGKREVKVEKKITPAEYRRLHP